MKNKDYIIHESNYNLQKSKDEEFAKFMARQQEGLIKTKKKC